MRFCIFGAGAVGGHLAAKLAAAGHDVSAIARGAHLEAMRARGVALQHGQEIIRGRVRASERTADLGPQDFVLVTLKANLLGSFADGAAPLLAPDTAVVFVQNGIPWWYGQGKPQARLPDLSCLDPGGKLARTIEPERVIGAVAYSANVVIEPGVIRNLVPGNNMLSVGRSDDADTEKIRVLRKALDAAGMPSPPTRDIRQSIWSKLSQNLANSTVCLLTGETVAGARGDAHLSVLLQRLKAEGEAIARAYGIALESAPQRPAGGQSSGMIAHKPSMLQDYELGRPLELDAQLVMPLAFARAAGVPSPTLEALVPLAVHKAAAKGLYRR